MSPADNYENLYILRSEKLKQQKELKGILVHVDRQKEALRSEFNRAWSESAAEWRSSQQGLEYFRTSQSQATELLRRAHGLSQQIDKFEGEIKELTEQVYALRKPQ